jgi:hypothetical protein
MAKTETNKPLKYPAWMPRFWHGMPPNVWFRVIGKHLSGISIGRMHHVIGVSLFSPMNAMLAVSQQLIWGRAIARAELVAPPVFVLGHWRSGTTLLHEYLSLDTQFATPTTYECFAPWHFLLTEGWVTRFGGFLLPHRRPMDNMQAGWGLPQEDEFAMVNLGAPSPYYRILFPNEEVPYTDTLSTAEFQIENLVRWKESLLWFLKALTLHNQKRMLLKSPPHTGRLGILQSMFPGSKYVHIVRDPRKLYPSTMNLWVSLDAHQALQSPTDRKRLHRFVVESLNSMYRAFETDRATIRREQIIDVTYESFVADPIATMEEIYRHLDLGVTEELRARWEQKQRHERGYQTNRLQLDTDEEAMILREWKEYAERYGYLEREGATSASARLINSDHTA